MCPQGRPEKTPTASKAGVTYDQIPQEGNTTSDAGIRSDEFSNGRKEPERGLHLPDQRPSKGGGQVGSQ